MRRWTSSSRTSPPDARRRDDGAATYSPAGAAVLSATFWLLDAPDSLAAQSHRNPDGAGIAVFEADGTARVDKQPIAAWDDTDFASAARELAGTTFVAHVRHASTGAHTMVNTQPFEQDRRLFAHNGVVEGLDDLDARLAIVTTMPFPRQPAHQLSVNDLAAAAAASQQRTP